MQLLKRGNELKFLSQALSLKLKYVITRSRWTTAPVMVFFRLCQFFHEIPAVDDRQQARGDDFPQIDLFLFIDDLSSVLR